MMLKKAYLEITNVCNLNCRFCPGTRREKRFMSADEFAFLAARLQGRVEYLYLHLLGEPLLHPQLGEILAIAAGMGFRIMLTTNGTLLDSRGDELISCPAVHKISISLQSFEANGGAEPKGYVNQCARFAAKAAAVGKICELRMWNRGGYESLNGEMISLLETEFPPPWDRGGRSVKLTERVWLADGDMFEWPELDAEDRGERCFCYGLRDQIGVLCDGTVVPCCLDHDGDVPLGNLFESELSDILSTERARAIYDGFSERRAVEELCRRCGYARRF